VCERKKADIIDIFQMETRNAYQYCSILHFILMVFRFGNKTLKPYSLFADSSYSFIYSKRSYNQPLLNQCLDFVNKDRREKAFHFYQLLI